MQFLRHLAAAILILVGICLALFSFAVAYGWGHKTLSALGIAFALTGYAVVFFGYCLLRDSDWEVVASTCMKGLLLVGCVLLIVASFAILYRVQEDDNPYTYLIITGCLSGLGYWRFQKYAAVN